MEEELLVLIKNTLSLSKNVFIRFEDSESRSNSLDGYLFGDMECTICTTSERSNGFKDALSLSKNVLVHFEVVVFLKEIMDIIA